MYMYSYRAREGATQQPHLKFVDGLAASNLIGHDHRVERLSVNTGGYHGLLH